MTGRQGAGRGASSPFEASRLGDVGWSGQRRRGNARRYLTEFIYPIKADLSMSPSPSRDILSPQRGKIFDHSHERNNHGASAVSIGGRRAALDSAFTEISPL